MIIIYMIFIYMIIIALTLNYGIRDWISQSRIISSLNDNQPAFQALAKLGHTNLESCIVQVLNNWKENASKFSKEFDNLESGKLLPHNILKIPTDYYANKQLLEKFKQKTEGIIKYFVVKH